MHNSVTSTNNTVLPTCNFLRGMKFLRKKKRESKQGRKGIRKKERKKEIILWGDEYVS